jgi:quercetin dioxygenase-like cupin family protein
MEVFKKISQAKQFAADKMKKNPLFSTDRFLCDLYCFEPGQVQAPHAHDGQDKIYYVVEGTGLFQVGDEQRELRVGEMALAPSGQNHGVTNSSKERLTVLVFVTPKPAHA